MNTLSLFFPIFGNPAAKVKTKSRIAKQGILKAVLIAQTFLALSFLALYIFQTGDLIRLSYQVKNTEQTIDELSAVSIISSNDSASQSYLAEIEAKIAQLDFVPVDAIKYLPLPPNRLAKKYPTE